VQHHALSVQQYQALMTKDFSNIPIILDSGSTAHLLPTAISMVDYTSQNGEVSLADNAIKLSIIGSGRTLLLSHVLHVPSVSFGIISVSKLDKEGYTITFQNGQVLVHNLDDYNDILFTGTLLDNLYFLDEPYRTILTTTYDSTEYLCSLCDTTSVPCNCHVNDNTDFNVLLNHEGVKTLFANDSELLMATKLTANTLGYNKLELIHNAWGHASERDIKTAFQYNKVSYEGTTYDGIKDLHIRFCPTCYYGRMRAFPRYKVSTNTYGPLEFIGVDWKGPFKVKSVHGEKGFFLFSDRKTNFLKVYTCANKSCIMDCLDDYMLTVVKHHDARWKVMQSDYAQDFLSEDVTNWCKENKIKTQNSAPYRQDQNGMVERDVGFLMDRARAMMAHFNTPRKYWNYAVYAAADVINTTHIPVSTKMTAYQFIENKIPDCSHYVPFYAPGVYHITKQERKNDTWKYKAVMCRFLGYSDTSKRTYILLNVEKNSIVTRSDAIFDESLYEVVREIRLKQDETKLDKLFGMLQNFYHFKNDALTEDETVNSCIYPMDINEEADDLEVHVLLTHYLEDLVNAAHNITPLPPAPANVEEALEGPERKQWKEAIDAEFKQLDKHEVLKWAEVQHGRGMKTKMVLQTKYGMDYSIRYKARFVVCGYSQLKGIEYAETFSPTISIAIVFLVIHLAAFLKLFTGSFDVHAAYVQAYNDFENYCWLSAALFGVRTRWLLNKALYGEKQAGMLWNKMLHGILTKMGMIQCPVAPCLYYFKKDTNIVIVCVYVDDGLMAGTSKQLLEEFVRQMHQYLPQVNLHIPL